ncbi:hypothetical protein BH11PLA2_BH11PLA2_37980 [soil metagenome]
MTRIPGILAIIVLASPLTAGEPVPAGRITLDGKPRTSAETAAYVESVTGVKIKFGYNNGFSKATAQGEPFWDFIQRLVMEGEIHRLRVKDSGKTLEIDGRGAKPTFIGPASADGAFRVQLRSVNAKIEQGGSYYDVTIEVHWEPRIPVFRIDTQPLITSAVDDSGVKLTSKTAKTKSPIGDSYLFTSTFRLDGLTRESKSIAKLEGSFYVTASPKMLAFTFDDLNAKLPVTKEQHGVSVTLAKFAPVENRWDAAFKLVYPESHPEFESFESWADGNKLRLINPDRTKTFSPDNFAISGSGSKLGGDYRFITKDGKGPVVGDRNGLTLVYDTPAPLTEFFVKFSLKDILLP